MSILIMPLIIACNFILQSTLLHHFSVFGIVPNTALVLVTIIGLLKGEKIAGTIGLAAGLLQDVVFSPIIGINGFILFFVGYSAGLAENKLSKDNMLIPFFMVLFYTVFYHFLYYIFMFFLSYNISILSLFRKTVITESVYNSLISILLYKWLSRIFIVPSIRFGRR